MPITSLLEVRLKPDSVDEGLAVLHTVLGETRAFDGCLGVQVIQDSTDPAHLVAIEQWESLEKDAAYRESVLPESVKARVSVEAGATGLWRGIVGDSGRTVGIDHFGASADYKTLFEKFGVTADAVVEAARATVKENA